MHLKRSYIFVRFLSILFVCSLIMPSIVPVFATDTIDDLENSASHLENELSGLNDELAQLNVEISSITEQIETVGSEIENVKEELAIAKGEEQTQYEAMKLRIVYMYENGNSNYLEMLFSATSMADFINRADFFATISEYDRTVLAKLVDTQELVMQKEAQLVAKQENLNQLLNELDQKEAAIRSQISSTSDELSAYTAKLEAAREEAKKAQDSLNQEVKPILPPEPEPEPEPDVPTDTDDDSDLDADISASASDIELFAALIECEAGSTDYEGMLAVASVVVNRMKNRYYPDTLRGVIYQSGQFPPAHDGKVDRVLKRGVKASCLSAAQDALNGKNNVGDCLSFRAASSGHTGIIIGDNVFF